MNVRGRGCWRHGGLAGYAPPRPITRSPVNNDRAPDPYMSGWRLLARNVSLVAVFALTMSCGLLPGEAPARQSVRISFRRSDAAAAAAFPGDYVSVLDTATLTVTPSGGATRTYRSRIAPRDSILRFEVELDGRSTAFDATVSSNNGRLLFAGQVSAPITATTDSVVISLKAQTPVLLLSLLFRSQVLRASVRPGALGTRFTLPVRNVGTGTLQWSVVLPCPGCTLVRAGGAVSPGVFDSVVVDVADTTATRPPRITIRSAEGSVTVP